MPKFIFAYHGGVKPETPEAGAAEMAKWEAWISQNSDAFADPGAPVGMSNTVSSGGVANNGGSNPLSGYSIVSAADIDAACDLAKGCPILDGDQGTVEVAPIMEM